MKFIHSNILKDWTVETGVKIIDLPTNPLSHILITMSGYNVTDEATLAEIIAFINKIEVTFQGMTIFSAESEDIFAMNCYLLKYSPLLTNMISTDNASRDITLVIPFGRSVFNPNECFPETKKGELQMRMDLTIPATSLDNGILNVQTVELPGASPTSFLKTTLLSITAPGAVGDNDIDLPIGNLIAGIMLYSTTGNQASSHAKGIETARVLVDNSESGYVSGRYMSIQAEAGYKVSTLTRSKAAQGKSVIANYIYLDYDPVKDSNYLLETEGKSSVRVRLNMGVDEAAKIMPIEIVDVAKLNL